MSDQPALTEEELERIRSLHVEWTARDGQGNPNGPTCSMDLNRWPCPMLSVLTTLDAERALRQAAERERDTFDQQAVENWALYLAEKQRREVAETALAEMTERAERAASVLADQAQQMREDITRRQAVERRLAEERQARERVEQQLVIWKDEAGLRQWELDDQSQAADEWAERYHKECAALAEERQAREKAERFLHDAEMIITNMSADNDGTPRPAVEREAQPAARAEEGE